MPTLVRDGIKELIRQNEITHFIEEFAVKEGFAIWDKAMIKKIGNNGQQTNNLDGNEEIAIIPLVITGQEIVNGFLVFKMNTLIEIHLIRANDYDKFDYETQNATNLHAENIVL